MWEILAVVWVLKTGQQAAYVSNMKYPTEEACTAELVDAQNTLGESMAAQVGSVAVDVQCRLSGQDL